MSKITSITTVRSADIPNVLWAEIATDDGLIGTGETFRCSEAVESLIHDQISPVLLGEDSRAIERLSRILTTPYLGFSSTGAETRAASAIDIALWDLKGQRENTPVHEALGGAARSEISAYNTCAGYSLNAGSSIFNSGTSRRIATRSDTMEGPYDDQVATFLDAGQLAESLLSEGYKAMKIWPFDIYAAKHQGQFISAADIEEGLVPFRKIRDAVGNKIEVMCELHSLWNFDSALRICNALEPYDVLWAEDPLCKMNDAQSLADLRSKTRVPICGSETIAGLVPFRDMLAANALDVVMLDLSWCGGLSQGRKIAVLAEAHGRPLAPHDCTGPIVLWAGVQLSMHAPAAYFQEVVRATLSTWYKDAVTELPVIRDGMIQAPTQPGIGARLRESFKERATTMTKTSIAKG